MTDRELLERAARALGWRLLESHNGVPGYALDGTVIATDGVATFFWRPRTDDGDALRLAVKLRISVRHEGGCVTADWAADHNIQHEFVQEFFSQDESEEAERPAATRRAIVRAAAAMVPEVAARTDGCVAGTDKVGQCRHPTCATACPAWEEREQRIRDARFLDDEADPRHGADPDRHPRS